MSRPCVLFVFSLMQMLQKNSGLVQRNLLLRKSSRLALTSFQQPYKSQNCIQHSLNLCPVCHSDEYMCHRIKKAVIGALKRLGLRRTKSILHYLGTNSWDTVLGHISSKRQAWNALHPQMPMTSTNIALDHIRPVREFQKESKGSQTLLCNHYTNLQPLLLEDNNWKGDSWSEKDEKFWHKNIILKNSYLETFYPEAAPTQPSLLSTRTGR